jgi:hypothetical protein
MTKRHRFILASIVIVTGSCEMPPIADPSEAQHRPEAMEDAAPGADSAAGVQPSSTICRAYHSQLLEFRTQLGEGRENPELRAAVTTLEGIITQACD